MKRLIIIVEGQTEKEFVEKSLRNYLQSFEVYSVSAIMIQTSKGHKGGFVNYQHLKNDIEKILNSEKDVIVSTFIDFFKIPTSFPNYDKTHNIQNTDQKIESLYQGIILDINDVRFIPYIQKYEFEAILFSCTSGFANWYDNSDIVGELCDIVNKNSNPEEINSGINTAPSKRIINILSKQGQKYDKIAEGNLIAEEIGIDKILEKCPLFKTWLNNLIIKINS